MDLSAIYLHTQCQTDQDFVGAREDAVISRRIQEAALFTIKGDPNAAGKSRHTVFLTASPLDAMAAHKASHGADVYAISTPSIPQWLIHHWTHAGKNRIITIGLTESEVETIKDFAQQAGWYGMVQRIQVEMAEHESSAGTHEKAPHRAFAWNIICTDGVSGLKKHLQTLSITVYKPEPVESGTGRTEDPASNKVQRFLQTAQPTGQTRTDRDHWFDNLNAASLFLDESLEKATHLHVAGIVSQPGQGKTHAVLSQMIVNDFPEMLVTPTVNLANEAYTKITEMMPKNCDRTVRLHVPRGPDTCARYPKVMLLQDANRGPYAQACKMADLNDSIPGDCEHAENCVYLHGIRLDSRAEILIAPHAAAASDSSLLSWVPEPVMDAETGEWENGEGIERLVTVDEETPAATSLTLDHKNVDDNISTLVHWLSKPTWIRSRVKGSLGKEFTEEKLQKNLDAYAVFRDALTALNTEYSKWRDPEKSRTPIQIRMSGAWRDFVDAYRKLPKELTLMDGSTLAERPVLNNGTAAPIIPKQWMAALVEGLNDRMVWIHNGNLVIGKEGGLWKNFMNQGGQNLDASMGLTQKAIISHRADSAVYTIPVHQTHLAEFQVIDGQQHGKAALKGHALPSEVRQFIAAWKQMIAAGGHGEAAGLVHKDIHDLMTAIFLRDQPDPDAAIEKALKALEKKNRQPGSKDWQILLRTLGIPDDPARARTQRDITVDDAWMLGHWGKDDRGHNRWKDAKAGFCWGVPYDPTEEYQIRYAIHRVIMARYGIDWPEWDGSVTRGQVILTNGGEASITTNFPLPSVPEARAFVLDSVNAQIAQGIGRWRGVRRTAENPVDIYLFMGDFPVAAVGHDHMLPNIEYVTDLGSAMAKKATKEVSVMQTIAELSPDQHVVMEAIREAVNNAFGFDPGDRLGRRVARAITNKVMAYAREHHLSLQEAAKALVRDIQDRFLPDPRAFPETAGYYLERLKDRGRWCRMFMGTGPWADAAQAVLDMLYEGTFTPEPPVAPPG
ncbi:hypothetical protein [Acidithiobacillus ferridurans]|uniref:Uncharacterized protein n=2 Tax=Acidithiobacillus ferridurans TaxID=1232575 RepID=A0A2Z6IH88_ACIFI|nr:hypothetical protein [Acidithiobacillus ferridurans]MBU2717266.1 hypothetical protein [Acidithiobacillus ferridurans]MBU2721725.1 hypothetical protein [Acidithiobacillus ferridurans]MBU2726247.1 hypothetical protein [Acidithiobacillus ferridurans]BBF63927.1 hypothetical protein AFERRID_01450 [Acidithiobacillus ferridurans]